VFLVFGDVIETKGNEDNAHTACVAVVEETRM
jgi:hypothetical protein